MDDFRVAFHKPSRLRLWSAIETLAMMSHENLLLIHIGKPLATSLQCRFSFAMRYRSPDFVGIGAQKAGTYWLRENLGRHPKVWMPAKAELHYFDPPLEGTGQLPCSADDDWYRSLFAVAAESSLVGEITPRYGICGDAEIAHMHAVAPRAKLLFLIRNPVERFWSQCRMKYADGSLMQGDSAAMSLFDSPNGRPRGEYSKTIVRYCRHFAPDQILLVFQDGIAREPERVLREIHSFLELSEVPIDIAKASSRVNAAADCQPMPEALRSRIAAAYRAEVQLLADIFGSYAASWLDGSEAPAGSAVAIRVTKEHVDGLRRRHASPSGRKTQQPRRLFCLSMQRSGTTSVGDWLEAHGLVRAGYPTSARLDWTKLWMRGAHEAIFQSPEFQGAEILEDDPWWCPDYYQFLATRFPDARFILLTRDPDDWFESLCHHSGGLNPGWSDIHARIYDREDDLRTVLASREGIGPSHTGLLSIADHKTHYQTVYQRHNQNVREFFAGMPQRLFFGRLEDPQTFIDLCDFAGVRHNPSIAIPRSNARTAEMAERLAHHRARMDR